MLKNKLELRFSSMLARVHKVGATRVKATLEFIPDVGPFSWKRSYSYSCLKNIVKSVVKSIVILWKFKLEGLSVEFRVHWRCARTCCVWRGQPILQLLLQSHLLTISWSVQSCTNLNHVVILVQTATAGGAWLVQVTVIPLTSVWVHVRVWALSWVSHVTWLQFFIPSK